MDASEQRCKRSHAASAHKAAAGSVPATVEGARTRPHTPKTGMTLITYQRQSAAIATPDRFYLAPHIDRLPDRHPLRGGSA